MRRTLAAAGALAAAVATAGTATAASSVVQLARGDSVQASCAATRLVVSRADATHVTLTCRQLAAGNPSPTPTPSPSPTSPAPTGVPGSWGAPVFDDEFDGNALDTSRWVVHEGWTVNNVAIHAANVAVSGGTAQLTLASASSGAEIRTSGFQLPVGGVAEARVLFPAAADGSCVDWPAWWTSGPPWPQAGEHDIAEVLRGGLSAENYHSPSGAHNGPFPAGAWCGTWHTYTLLRGATTASVYWDGQLIRTVMTDDNGGGEDLILNIGVGQGSTTVTGAQLLVDWVRAWTSQ